MELTLLNNQTVISVRRNISHKRTGIRAGTQKSAHCQSNKFFHSHLILLIKTVLIIRHKSLMANIILLLLQITSSYYSCSLILFRSSFPFSSLFPFLPRSHLTSTFSPPFFSSPFSSFSSCSIPQPVSSPPLIPPTQPTLFAPLATLPAFFPHPIPLHSSPLPSSSASFLSSSSSPLTSLAKFSPLLPVLLAKIPT